MNDNKSKPYFATRTINELEAEVQSVYLESQHPWIIGYSGGKDSTCTVQIVWSALSKLKPEQLKNPVYILSSDTLVETPIVVNHIVTNIASMQTTLKSSPLPFKAQIVRPEIKDSFWVNLIGKGYPAPSTQFRWCTDRLKIKPANKFIEDQLSEYGGAVVVLGARKDESITRQQVMELKSRQIPGSKLTHHSTMASAFCYTPIADFTVKDVWDYLLQNKPPWGTSNRDLVTMYRNAQDGECPLVIDTTTSSCGNSRFGCWVCTVVTSDQSMEAMVDAGEDWLQPLLEFRDKLASTREPEKKAIYRNFKRRNGTIQQKVLKEKGKRTEQMDVILGPYFLQYRKEFLRELLIMQKDAKDHAGEHFELITQDELLEIRRIWRYEEVEDPDWEDSLPSIYEEAMGIPFSFEIDDSGDFTLLEANILQSVCEEEGVPTSLIKKLLVAEQKGRGMNRRAGVFKEIRKVFNEDWRSQEEFMDALKAKSRSQKSF